MHHLHPEWDIALVFNTQSLYEEIRSQVHAAFNDIGGTWDTEKLHVIHAWGGRYLPGFYSRVMNAQGLQHLSYGDVPKHYKRDGLPYACHQYLVDHDGTIPHPKYDAVLIDEGQDLVTDRTDLLYEGRQPFYWFAYQALRPASQKKKPLRRLIWAYDEYQTITTRTIPTTKEIFGQDPANRWAQTGKYPDGSWKSIVLKTCYRTPGPIILASHALAMGLFRREGQIAGPTTRAAWEALGYEVQGDFRQTNSEITLRRPPALSPNPLTELNGDIPFKFSIYKNRYEERKRLGEQICNDISEGLDPRRHILVIVLHNEPGSVSETLYEDFGIDSYFAGSGEKNSYYRLEESLEKPEKFREDGAVTVTGLNKAKGNEGDMIYIVGLDEIARKEGDITARNKLFVALTRSRGWVRLSGIGRHPLYNEVEEIDSALRKDPCRLNFTLRMPKFPLNATEEDPDGLMQSSLGRFGL